MTDLLITEVGDAWVNSLKTGLNYGSTNRVSLKSGERRGFLLPPLPSIAGRTVLSATLVGRVAAGHVAQTYTVAVPTARWSPGRITWANQPAVGASVTEVVGSALPDGGLVEVDVEPLITSVAAGAEWFGLRITTNSTSTGQSFYSTDSGDPAWELHVVLSDAPEQPSNLRPDGGAVKDGEPILAWDFVDLGGESTAQAQSQVQVDSPAVAVDPDEVAPDYDSGWVANVDPQYNLAAVTYTPPGSPAQSTYWRVRVKDGAGVTSEWSDWADFTVDSLPTLVVDSPVGAFGDPSPQVTAHLTGGTLASWKAWATGSNRADVRAESGIQTGAVDWQVPFRSGGRRVLVSGESGWIYLRVHDDVDRAVAVGQKTYVDTWISANLTESATPTAPTGLTVTPLADGDPRSVWQWSRTEVATGYVFKVDGEEIARVDAEDITVVGGGVYSWTDAGEVPPLLPHTLKVVALEGDDQSHGPTVTQAHTVKGVWLIPEDTDIAPVVLAGTAVEGFTRTDRMATYTPLEGHEIDVIYDNPGRVGTFEGSVDSRQDVDAALGTIKALRKSRNRKARLTWGSQTALVNLRDPDATSHGDIMPGNLMHVVRFGFVEVGE